jgi:hypothetical protein
MDANVEQIIAAGQLATELLGQAQAVIGLYLTVTSGYLLVAYLVGKDLTRVQVSIITTLFVVFQGIATIAVMSYFASAEYIGHTYGAARAPTWGEEAMGLVFSAGILACLKFMWDVRHPKSE